MLMLARAYGVARTRREAVRRAAVPARARDVARARPDLPDRLPDRPERDELERDRRRLLGRDRRRPDRGRVGPVRQLSRRQPLGRHVRPGQLLRLHPLRAGVPLVGHVGRPAGRARAPHWRSTCSRCSRCSSPAGCCAGGREGNILGLVFAYAWAAYPVHAVRAQLERQRLADRAARDGRLPGAGASARARRRAGARRIGEVRAARARPACGRATTGAACATRWPSRSRSAQSSCWRLRS